MQPSGKQEAWLVLNDVMSELTTLCLCWMTSWVSSQRFACVVLRHLLLATLCIGCMTSWVSSQRLACVLWRHVLAHNAWLVLYDVMSELTTLGLCCMRSWVSSQRFACVIWRHESALNAWLVLYDITTLASLHPQQTHSVVQRVYNY